MPSLLAVGYDLISVHLVLCCFTGT